MKKILIMICASVGLLIGCSAKPNTVQPANKINPEILGSWNDDNGCTMSIELINNQLILRDFNNSHNVEHKNILLQWSKQSVFTVFKSAESGIDFSGSFSDGFITIDNDVCSKILHKDGTK